MRVNWFFRRNRCCCCRCGHVRTDSSSGIYTVYTLQHFADVPMQIYYGPGYTERNVLESMDEALHTLADTAETLQRTCGRCNSCNSCNSCHPCNSHCSC